MYLPTLRDEHRTNNASEGGNNAIKTAAGCAHPTIWKCIEKLREFNSEMELHILHSDTGMPADQQPRTHWRLKQERIKRIVQTYDPNTVTHYCRRLGYLF